jgi:signal transduction histidine kinase
MNLPPRLATSGFARLRWLIRLRWQALFGASVAAVLAAAGLVPGVNVPLVALAVTLGIATNMLMVRRARRRGSTDERHVGQALLDTGALTVLVWAAGSLECPFVVFYVFPVLLAGLLGGRRALLPAGVATAAGIGFQVVASTVPAMRVGHWDPPPAWDLPLTVAALAITVLMAAYFAARFTDVLRQQVRARREADALLRLAVQGLDAGLEVVDAGRVAWQNPRAAGLVGERVGEAWSAPPAAEPAGDHARHHFVVHPERIYEMLRFPLPEGDERHMVLYVDRTGEVLADRRLVLTERLASLGRTVQGVAHELNTPLATIQTLARDLRDALALAAVDPALRADLDESADLILAEVQRCSRITHALLGRAERLGPEAGGELPLAAAVERAAALVFMQDRARLALDLGSAAGRPFPLDPLVQIFVNLLQNARDADPRGRIQVRAEVGDEVVLTVRDHGPGLPPGAQGHLFEPFFTTKPPGQGTGLGLYTSYALARRLGGSLGLDDHPEGGAIATLRLPLSAPSIAVAASPGTP